MRWLLALLATFALVDARAANYAARPDVAEFVNEMTERHGMDRATLMDFFRQTRHLPAVIKAIMPPRDPGIRSWQAYRARFVESRRIAAGHRFMQAHAAYLGDAEARYGVPKEIIAAIIGVETIYGRHTGRFGTFSALTTLAFDYPPRAALFRRELEELLLLAREEERSPLSYRGSYAGALGLPQFLPSSRRLHGLDFDGDGRIDLAASVGDAIGSVANFLANHGWERGAPIAVAVNIAGDGVKGLIDEGIQPRRSPLTWTDSGAKIVKVGAGGTAISGLGHDLPDRPAALIDLVTPHAETEYRVGYGNFFVITRYNRSSFYAAAVMDLAAELRASQ